MTTYAASVTIVDLPVGDTVTGAELIEAVQTTNGVVRSVQLSLSQVAALSKLNSFVKTVGTSLATSGTATAIVAFVKTSGIGSTQLGALAVQSSNLTTGAVGSTQLGAFAVVAGSIATSAVGSTQLDAFAVQQANITAAAIGSTQIANFAITAGQINTAAIGTAQMAAGALGMTLLNTLLPSAVASSNDTTSLTSTYRNYMVTFENIVPANNTTGFLMQIATTGANWTTSGYMSFMTVLAIQSSVATAFSLSGNSATTSVNSNAGGGLSGSILLLAPAFGAGNNKFVVGNTNWINAPNTLFLSGQPGGSVGATIYSGINFLFTSGNIATGVIKIYGMP